MFDLSGRKALVTGASGGIGEEIARVLHAIGLSRHKGMSFGRFHGTLWTWAAILAMAITLLVRTLLPS